MDLNEIQQLDELRRALHMMKNTVAGLQSILESASNQVDKAFFNACLPEKRKGMPLSMCKDVPDAS